jgi:O-antigen/teichoic acid export membrane protein
MSALRNLYSKYQLLFGSDLVNTVIVTGALFIVSFLAYLLQFYLGRTLTVEGFGDFTVLLSLAGILAFVGNVIGYAVVKVYSELSAQEEYSKIKWLFFKTIKYSSILGVLFGLVSILLSSVITNILNIQSINTVLFFGLHLIFIFSPVYVAVFLQGTSRFVWFSAFVVIAALLRLIFPIIFVQTISNDPENVYLGFFVGLVISLLFGFLVARHFLLKGVSSKVDRSLLHNISKNSIYNGLALLTLTTMISIDLVAVKYYFEPFEAGIYSGVVTLGKIVIFGAGTVATVMFPRAVSVNKDYKAFIILLKKFGVIQVFFAVSMVLLFTLFPSLITHTLFGEKFASSIPYLALYTLFVGLYVLANFAVLSLVALGAKKFSLYMPVFLVIQLIGLVLFHGTLYQIILVNIISLLLLFSFIMFTMYIVLKKFRNQMEVSYVS